MDSFVLVKVKISGKDIIIKSIGNRTQWDAVKVLASIATGIENRNWYFSYLDEEGDEIVGSTEIEWKAAVCVCQENKEAVIRLYPEDNSSLNNSNGIQQSNTNTILHNESYVDKTKDNSFEVGCVTVQSSNKCCKSNNNCCPSQNLDCKDSSSKYVLRGSQGVVTV